MTEATTILLVEDDPSDVMFFERALSKSQIPAAVRIARDGQEAQDYLSSAAGPRPAYIYLDLKLPRKDGLELLEWITAQAPLGTVAVVVLTSSGESGDVERAFRLGARAYCVKPLETAKLMSIVESVHAWLTEGRRLPEDLVVSHFLAAREKQSSR